MLELEIQKNDLGLFQANAVLTLSALCVSRQKADRDDLEYELRRAFEEIVGEIATKQLKDEF